MNCPKKRGTQGAGMCERGEPKGPLLAGGIGARGRICRVLAMAALLGGTAAVGAASVEPCTFNFSLDKMREVAKPISQMYLDFDARLRTGENVSFAPGDPVLVSDVKLIDVQQALVPNTKLMLKTSWFGSPNHRFEAGANIPLKYEYKASDGRTYRIFNGASGTYLFYTDEGKICDKVHDNKMPVWLAGSLTLEPDDAVIELKVVEQPIKQLGLRIIFNGIQSGMVNLQEIWVLGGRVVSSKARQYDQFAKSILVAGMPFQVVSTEGGRITLNLESGKRVPVSDGFGRYLRDIDRM